MSLRFPEQIGLIFKSNYNKNLILIFPEFNLTNSVFDPLTS